MNANKEEILFDFIQEVFSGKIKPDADINLKNIVSSIIQKLELNKTLVERNSHNVEKAIGKFNDMINDIHADMDIEMQQLGKDEILLKNFINGQKTACDKLQDKLQNL